MTDLILPKGMQVTPIAGALGAEIEGVDLSTDLDTVTFEAVHRAFLDHQVIFFRDQSLSPEAHKRFARRFGSLTVHPYVKGMDDHPEVVEIIKEPQDKMNFGGGWHSDTSFMEKPALGSILHALEVPPYGGDTLFASQYLAYETLSEGMRDLLDSMTALHTAKAEYGRQGNSAQKRSSMDIENTVDDTPVFEHPVVRTHPETGRKALYINGAFTEKFKNMSRKDSLPLLNHLFVQATREEITCRFRWTKGAVAFWDNRCVQHFALNDYHGHRRHMRRVTINGGRPT